MENEIVTYFDVDLECRDSFFETDGDLDDFRESFDSSHWVKFIMVSSFEFPFFEEFPFDPLNEKIKFR